MVYTIKTKQKILKSELLNKNIALLNLKELSKKETIIIEQNNKTKKILYPRLTTLEIYDIRKLLTLRKALGVKFATSSIKRKKYFLYKRQFNLITKILDTKKYKCFVEDNKLYRSIVYCYISGEGLGRLYPPNSSLPTLKSNYRPYLLKHLYTDVDLINSHATILFKYAVENSLEAKNLKKLVLSRAVFYNRVTEEGTEVSAKQDTIRTLNKSFYFGKSKTLKSLNQELKSIRNHLWIHYYPDNKECFDARFSRNTKKDKYVQVQSLFCHTEETHLLLKLHKFMLSKIKSDCEQERSLFSFVPFLDGALIRFYKEHQNLEIPTYVAEFNETLTITKFKIKPISVEETDVDSKNIIDLARLIEKTAEAFTKYRVSDVEKISRFENIPTTVFDSESLTSLFENSKIVREKTKTNKDSTKKKQKEVKSFTSLLARKRKKGLVSDDSVVDKMRELKKQIYVLRTNLLKKKYYYVSYALKFSLIEQAYSFYAKIIYLMIKNEKEDDFSNYMTKVRAKKKEK